MDARGLVEDLYPNARIREIAAGQNLVYRVHETETESSIVKVYPVVSRERRERHALEALAGVTGVPQLLNHGIAGDSAWLKMTDGGAWSLANLPKNLDNIEAAGAILRNVHGATANITNLTVGIDHWITKGFSVLSSIEKVRRCLPRKGDRPEFNRFSDLR